MGATIYVSIKHIYFEISVNKISVSILFNLIKLGHKSAYRIYINKALLIPMSSQHFDITLNETISVELILVTLRPILHNLPLESDNDRKSQYLIILDMFLLKYLIHRISCQ